MIDRLAALDFDHGLEPVAAIGGRHDQVGVDRRGTGANRRVLFGAGIDTYFKATPVSRLEQPNNPIVLELLANRSHEDWAHTASTYRE
jgi:hypothetical protein